MGAAGAACHIPFHFISFVTLVDILSASCYFMAESAACRYDVKYSDEQNVNSALSFDSYYVRRCLEPPCT